MPPMGTSAMQLQQCNNTHKEAYMSEKQRQVNRSHHKMYSTLRFRGVGLRNWHLLVAYEGAWCEPVVIVLGLVALGLQEREPVHCSQWNDLLRGHQMDRVMYTRPYHAINNHHCNKGFRSKNVGIRHILLIMRYCTKTYARVSVSVEVVFTLSDAIVRCSNVDTNTGCNRHPRNEQAA